MTDFNFIDTGKRWIIFSDALKYRKEAHPRIVIVDGKIADVGCVLDPGPNGKFTNPFSSHDFDENLAEAVIRYYLYEVLDQRNAGFLLKLFSILRPPQFSGYVCFRGLSDIPQAKLTTFRKNLTAFGLFPTLQITETPEEKEK